MGILDVLSIFDWVTPTAAAVQDVANHGSHTLLITATGTLSCRRVEQLLHRFGVKTWGVMIVDEYLMVTVPGRQVDKAHRVLDIAGVAWEQ